MRNHRKIKSLRVKFVKNNVSYGYSLWNMFLEYLTGCDGNEFEHSDEEYELLSGDFGFHPDEIKDFVDHCLKIELFFNRSGFIHSVSLDDRLAPVYKKRGVAKELSQTRKRKDGKFVAEKSGDSAASKETVTVMPQSKVEENKTEESKEVKKFDFKKSLLTYGFDAALVDDWLIARKKKKCSNTETAFKGFIAQVEKTGKPINMVLKLCAEKGWGGFEAEWFNNIKSNGNEQGQSTSKTNKLRAW